MQSEIIPVTDDQARTLGEVGRKVVDLANDLLNEISNTWDENTIEQVKENGQQLVAKAADLQIATKEDYDQANEFFLQISQYLRTGVNLVAPFVEIAHKPWKILCEIRSEFEKPGKEAKKIIDAKIVEFKTAERRRQQVEQERLDRERREREAAERARLEQKAREEREKARQAQEEADRKAREIREKADRERAEGRAAEAKKLEIQAARAKAKAATEAQAREERARDHEEAAQTVYIPPTIVPDTVAKTETTKKGTAVGQKDWLVEITDEMELIKAVANKQLPLSVLNLDPERIKSALKRWAKVSLNVQRYAENGVVIEETERLTARTNSRAKADK